MKLFPVIDFSNTMQEKKFQEPLLTTLGENLVATWKFWLLFCGYPRWEVRSTRIYKKLLKLSYYVYTSGKVSSVKTSLHGFLLACRLHNLMDPGSNPVGSKNLFSIIFEVFLDENRRFFCF